MENMTLTTPALLFPAISLLLLAYTNRFLTLAQVIRQLHPGKSGPVTELAMRQLGGLKRRIGLIKLMQGFGVMSFLLCALSMFALFIEVQTAGKVLSVKQDGSAYTLDVLWIEAGADEADGDRDTVTIEVKDDRSFFFSNTASKKTLMRLCS